MKLLGVGVVVASLAGCGEWPGTPVARVTPVSGSREAFDLAYAMHCAACHGHNGVNGAARPLNDPLYLSITPPSAFAAATAHGSGVLMPPFGTHEGGPLDASAIKTFVDSVYTFWGTGSSKPVAAPLYASTEGDPLLGATAFESWCGACHGADGALEGHSVVDPFYLQLVSEQAVRSAIIFGRPSLGMPSYQGPFPDKGEAHLDAATTNDITAWLLQRRAEAMQ